VQIVGGHPFYLQLLGESLTAQPPPYDEGSLKQAVQELLFSSTGRFSLYLEKGYQALVGQSTYLAAALQALAWRPQRLSEIGRAIGALSGSTVRYLERLQDAVQRREDGRYELTDPTFGLWLRWRQPGGMIVPMSVIGSKAELLVARHLARMGFDLIYQSRASRGAFALLATRAASQLGLQVRRSPLPLRIPRPAWERMDAEAERLGWRWVVAAVSPPPDDEVRVRDPARARLGKEVRLGEEATIPNLLRWLDGS